MAQFKIQYRPEVMTINDMCTLEKPGTFLDVRELLAKHVINGNGEYVEDQERAQKLVGAMPKEKASELLSQLYKQIGEYNKAKIGDDPN